MSSTKKAISLPNGLAERIDSTAGELNMSRSEFLATAAERYLRDLETEKLIRSINEAYAEGPDAEELAFLEAARRSMGALMEREEW